MNQPVATKTFGRRVSVEISPEMDIEVRKLEAEAGMNTAELFRSSLSIMKLYLEARANDRKLMIVDPEHPENTVRVEIPKLASSKR
jgi:hypothetical protein